MRQFGLIVTSVARRSGGVQITCAGSAPIFAPGQAALAMSQLPAQPLLRLPLYPFHSSPSGLEFCVAEGEHPYGALHPGDELDVLGPCGRGFVLPERPGHLLLAADTVARLMSVLDWAVERGWSVALWLPPGAPPPGLLPELVEMHRQELSAELLGWADVVALDLPDPARRAAEIRAMLPGRAAGFVQALVPPAVPMPCGTGACQACWVPAGVGSRRRLACVDGPVFQW